MLPSLLLILLPLFLAPHPAVAYTIEKHDDEVTGDLVLSPPKTELVLRPGETTYVDMLISNRTGRAASIKFPIEDFEGSRDPGQATVLLGDQDSSWGARHWLATEIAGITLEQGETLAMKVKVTVPPTAEPGGHYAAVLASTTSQQSDSQGASVNVTSRVGCLFLVRVGGDVKQAGTLNAPEIPGSVPEGPVDIGVVFNNLGNIHLKPAGRVIIENSLGQTVAEIPIDEWVVMPGSSRRTTVTWPGSIIPGRYTARAEVTFDGQVEPLSETTTFWVEPGLWVVPWKAGAGALSLLGAGTVLITGLIWRQRRLPKL